MSTSAVSSFEKPEMQAIVIAGELATIECIGNDAFASWNTVSSLQIGEHIQTFAAVDPYSLMVEDFSHYILGEQAWIPTIDQSLYVAKLLDQIQASNR